MKKGQTITDKNKQSKPMFVSPLMTEESAEMEKCV